MNIPGKKTSSSFFRKILFFIIYFFTGFIACFFAFVLAVNFLNPAVSEEQVDQVSQKEKVTTKKVFKDIVKNLKQVLKESFPTDEKKESPSAEKSASPLTEADIADTPKEDLDSSDSFPEAPENFEGETYGNTIQASPKDSAQPVDSQGTVQPAVVQPIDSQGTAQPAVVQPIDGQGTAQPAVVQPIDGQGTVQPVEEPSEANIEVQSYMAPFIYDSIQQKDPFEDPTVDKREGIVIIPRTPPEKYDLSEINLKGVKWDKKNPKLSKALFELPSSEGFYELREGDKIGKTGVVFRVGESEVVVVETNYIGSGKNKKEKRVIKIKKMDRLGLDI